jgi:hypothetical protein
MGDGTHVDFWDSAETEQHFWALLWHVRGRPELMRGGDADHHRGRAIAKLKGLVKRSHEVLG